MAQNDLYKLLFDAAPDAMFVIDLQNRCIRDCNAAALDLLASERKHVIGADIAWLESKLEPTHTSEVLEALSKGNIKSHRCWLKSTRTNVSLLLTGDKIETEEQSMLVVTLKKQDLMSCHDPYCILKEMIDSVDQVFWVHHENKVLYISAAFEQLSGLPASLVMEHPSVILDIIHPADKQRLFDAWTTQNGLLDGEFRFFRPDGSQRWIWVKTDYLNRHDAGNNYITGVIQDITVMKKTESKLELARRDQQYNNEQLLQAIDRSNELILDAKQASSTKSAFLANVSHEIRTPLNGIIGMTDILMETPLSEEQTKFVDIIHISSDALLALVNEVLDFSKIEAGKVELVETQIDLHRFIPEIIKMVAHRAQKKNIKVTFTIDGAVSRRLIGDRGKIRQILLNLCVNAIKFTDNGNITIAVTSDHINIAKGWQKIKIAVTDTGIGITPEIKSKLFRPFVQGDSSITRKYGGTGLGLAITKMLVQLMGGEIDVISEEGEGSTFWFTLQLPFAKAEEQVHHMEPPPQADVSSSSQSFIDSESLALSTPPAENNSTAKILLVEDNLVNQHVAKRMIAKLGYHVSVASNGLEALNELQANNSYDLVLMDCQMPVMSGIEATKAIREKNITSNRGNLPIIAMTAHAMAGDRDICIAAGMDDYIAKPIKKIQLDQMISKWLPQPE